MAGTTYNTESGIAMESILVAFHKRVRHMMQSTQITVTVTVNMQGVLYLLVKDA